MIETLGSTVGSSIFLPTQTTGDLFSIVLWSGAFTSALPRLFPSPGLIVLTRTLFSLSWKQAFHHVFKKEGVSCGLPRQEGGPFLPGLWGKSSHETLNLERRGSNREGVATWDSGVLMDDKNWRYEVISCCKFWDEFVSIWKLWVWSTLKMIFSEACNNLKRYWERFLSQKQMLQKGFTKISTKDTFSQNSKDTFLC